MEGPTHIPQRSEQSLARAVRLCFYYINTCCYFKLSYLFFPVLVYCLTPLGNTNSPQQPPLLPCSPLPSAVPGKTAFQPGAGTGLSPSHLPVQMDKLRPGAECPGAKARWDQPRRARARTQTRSERGFPQRPVFVPGACVFQDATEAIVEKRRLRRLGPRCGNKGLRTQTRSALAEGPGWPSAAGAGAPAAARPARAGRGRLGRWGRRRGGRRCAFV